MKHFFTFIVCAFLSLTMIAQGKMDDKAKSKDDKGGKFDRSLDYDYKVEKKAQVTVKGKAIPYQVTAATLPVWDESGKTIAGVFYTYYERTDVNDKTTRPLVISFNGGPGTPSVWMEIGYTGPRILNIDDEGYPVQPYGLRDNPYSIIDVAELYGVAQLALGNAQAILQGPDMIQSRG